MTRPMRSSPHAAALALASAALAMACSGEDVGGPGGPSTCAPGPLLVAASDYSSSAVGLVGERGTRELVVGVDLGNDPQLATSAGRAFFLARDNDLVFELDALCGAPTRRIDLRDGASLPKLKNPQDVAVAPNGDLFVPLFGVPAVAVWREGQALELIDLAAHDEDGNPQASAVAIVGSGAEAKAFVALERLDDAAGLRSSRASTMLVIDVVTRRVEQAVPLAGRNPFGRMSAAEGALFLAEPGSFDSADDALAGIERFDTATRTTRLVVGERDLGGSAAQVAVDGECGAAIVADPVPNVNRTSLVSFSTRTGRVNRPAAIGPTDGYDLQGLAFRSGTLFVGDRRRARDGYPIHSLRVGASCELVAEPPRSFVPQKPVALAPTAGAR